MLSERHEFVPECVWLRSLSGTSSEWISYRDWFHQLSIIAAGSRVPASACRHPPTEFWAGTMLMPIQCESRNPKFRTRHARRSRFGKLPPPSVLSRMLAQGFNCLNIACALPICAQVFRAGGAIVTHFGVPSTFSEHEALAQPLLEPGQSGWNSSGMHSFDTWWTGSKWIASVDGVQGNVWSIGIYEVDPPSL